MGSSRVLGLKAQQRRGCPRGVFGLSNLASPEADRYIRTHSAVEAVLILREPSFEEGLVSASAKPRSEIKHAEGTPTSDHPPKTPTSPLLTPTQEEPQSASA